MSYLYIAHRLFAFHDRMLAARLAELLSMMSLTQLIFLPYCDTDEDIIQVPQKGYYLFQKDVERLDDLELLVAILHGPSYDDGVCMEIGYAYCKNTPLVLLTTDFITYSFANDPEEFVFADPILEILSASIVRAEHPYPDDPESTANRYIKFRKRNAQALQEGLSRGCEVIQDVLNNSSPIRPINKVAHRKNIYIEPSPFCSGERYKLLRDRLEKRGWTVFIGSRFSTGINDVRDTARTDLNHALTSNVLILDGNGPEAPAGAALLVGMGLAMKKRTILYYSGSQVTHAGGREENARNLMILYGSSLIASSFDQLEELAVGTEAGDAAR